MLFLHHIELLSALFHRLSVRSNDGTSANSGFLRINLTMKPRSHSNIVSNPGGHKGGGLLIRVYGEKVVAVMIGRKEVGGLIKMPSLCS